MFCRNREVSFDSIKIINAIRKVFGLTGSPEWNPASKIIDMMVAVACGDSEAQESWERYCARRDEKLNREQELKSINNLLTSVMGRRHDKHCSSEKTQISMGELRRKQLGKRQSECDGKVTELATMMPVPPLTLVQKGGQNICTTGV
ncbi:MAG: hypothetical protein E7335_11385 [Clostridiales bacterium]|nr:hypothetical protein [Clostridiales bacterium]